MDPRDASRTVGELVTERPARSRVFEQFGIDYCCGGRRPLAAACHEAGVQPGRVLEALAEVDAATAGRDEQNWAETGSAELVEHILTVHHAFLRRELPRLSEMLDKVVEAHGANHPSLADVRTTYTALRAELEQHMFKEEQILFPAIVEPGGGSPCFGTFDGPIGVMEHEHANAGRALERLRELTGGYEPPEDACNTYRAMLDGLAELERDLHRHIHEENNVLFPRYATASAG